MRYFTNCKCIEDVKEEYRRLAKKLHPDNGGDAEEFKRMMQAYTSAYNRYKGVHRKQTDKATQDTEKATQGDYTSTHDDYSAEQYADIINKVIGLDGVDIEIVGTWIWLSGNTFVYKDTIKAAGFFWSTKHKKWYYNGGSRKSKKHSKMSFEQVKAVHGCTEVKNTHRAKLA